MTTVWASTSEEAKSLDWEFMFLSMNQVCFKTRSANAYFAPEVAFRQIKLFRVVPCVHVVQLTLLKVQENKTEEGGQMQTEIAPQKLNITS